jgi:hypothetical protein
MLKIGKPFGPLLRQKSSYITDNDRLLSEKQAACDVYVQQPLRTACKNCNQPLGADNFQKAGVSYKFCERCGHLNGANEDSAEFCRQVYVDDGGTNYAQTYTSASKAAYTERVKDIYLPKAEFLCDGLRQDGQAPNDLSYADFGAGSGYFVAALRQLELQRSMGYEVSQAQVELANAMADEAVVQQHDLDKTADIARHCDADVISMIGVLEHLQKPRDALQAIRDNENVRYFYISVPLFSPCVFFEMLFPSVMDRQLTARHTHLYTDASLQWMCQEFGFERISEWWFGTDVVDLYRAVSVRLSQMDGTQGMTKQWQDTMLPVIDKLQMIFDENRQSSEVHMLLKKPS